MFIGQIGRVHILRDTTEAGGAGGAGQVEAGAASTTETTSTREETTSTGAGSIPEGFTKQEWDNLTPGEQAGFAITNEQINDEEDGFPDPDDLDGILEEGGEAAAKPEAAKPADTTGAEQAKPADAATETTTTDAAPLVSDEDLLATRINVPAPELVKGIPEDWKAKFAEIDAQFKEGDLDDDARDAAKEELRQDLSDWKIQQRETARENALWIAEQRTFLDARPGEYKEFLEDGKTFTDRSEMLFGALSSQVAKLLRDPANKNKTGMQILIQADKIVCKTFNITRGAKPAAAAAKLAEPAKPAAPQAKLSKDAVNLSTIPAAGTHDTDPFAWLDNLQGIAKEEALAALTPQQEAAYMRGARG